MENDTYYEQTSGKRTYTKQTKKQKQASSQIRIRTFML